MNDQANPSSGAGDDTKQFAERIKGIRVAMVTLPGSDGALHGRPLTVQDHEFDGSLWFLVSRTADWTSGIGAGVAANVAMVDGGADRWISVAGTAALVEDRARIAQMWSGLYDAWFDGPEDPDVVLLRFDTHSADYWDVDTNKIVRLAKLVK